MTTEVHDMAIAIILECSWNDEEDSEIVKYGKISFKLDKNKI